MSAKKVFGIIGKIILTLILLIVLLLLATTIVYHIKLNKVEKQLQEAGHFL